MTSTVESKGWIKQKGQGRAAHSSVMGQLLKDETEDEQKVLLRHQFLLRTNSSGKDKEEGKVTEGAMGTLCQLDTNWCHLRRGNLSWEVASIRLTYGQDCRDIFLSSG